MTAVREILLRNLESVQRRIAQAAARSGRDPAAVRVVAVTKYVSAEVAEELVELGIRDLGESRPQELWCKSESLAHRALRWHLVGHLQRNKVRRTLERAQWIHSVDSARLLRALDRVAGELAVRPKILIEVNISGEAQKHGFRPESLIEGWSDLEATDHLEVCGLMGMSAWGADEAEVHRQFGRLREVRDRLREMWPSAASVVELSMGMSADYPIAVEEGATVIRVGSALFAGIGP